MRKFVAFSPLPNVKILLFISSLTHIVQPVTIKGTSDAVRPALCRAPAREGYISNAFAHSLNTHKSQTIGIICPVIADANHAYPVSELTKLLRAAHLETLLINTDSNPESKRPYFASLINRQVDAAIVIGCNCSAQERRDFAFAAAHFPVFVVNGVVPGKNIYCTVCDEKKAAHQAVLRLAGAGLRRILYLYDSQTYSGVQKLEGYCQGMRELPGGEPLCVQIRCDGPSYPRTIEVVSELLDRTPFDAILCDSYIGDATLFIQTLKEQNYSPKMIVAKANGFTDPSFITNLGNIANGVASVVEFNPDLINGKEINEEFKAIYGVDMNGHSAESYTVVWLFKAAIEAAGTTDGEAVKNALDALVIDGEFAGGRKIILPYSKIDFENYDLAGEPHYRDNTSASVAIAQIQDGAWTTVWPFEFASSQIVYPAPLK